MAMPSVMSHQFSQVPRAEIPRSSFDRSHGLKTAFDSGLLIPVFVDEALPGDTFSLSMTGFCRLATPLRPFMDNVFVNSFFFAVPLRLLWDNFQKFMGEQTNPGDSTDFLCPLIDCGPAGLAENSLGDYFGIPTKVADLEVSAFPWRAYNLIWNEWFRDQNLQDTAYTFTGDTVQQTGPYPLRRRGKRHDYFTSSLPWPQKGPGVQLPLSGTANVRGIGSTTQTYGAGVLMYETGGIQTTPAASSNTVTFQQDPLAPGFPYIYTDLSTATMTSINELRQAFQLQKLYERDARGGTRYTEIVRAHFNVISPDARLQRPEYLGGGQGIVSLHQVPQNSATDAGGTLTPQGNLAAYGTAMVSGHGFTHSFTEHCVIIGMVSVRADLNYQTGLNRLWSRRSKYDFFWPALAMIGEQAVLNKEIFAQGPGVLADGYAVDDHVFGYQERFAEYRYKPSLITGEMRSNAQTPLDTWHLAQDFAALPALDAAFIEDNPPIDRVLAVPGERQFIGDFYFRLRCARPMPVYGVPGLIDHF